MRYFTIDSAPRSNPEGRLDAPFILVSGTTPSCRYGRRVHGRAGTRDLAETKLEGFARRHSLVRVDCNLFREDPIPCPA
jgi:hypothetical protein